MPGGATQITSNHAPSFLPRSTGCHPFSSAPVAAIAATSADAPGHHSPFRHRGEGGVGGGEGGDAGGRGGRQGATAGGDAPSDLGTWLEGVGEKSYAPDM